MSKTVLVGLRELQDESRAFVERMRAARAAALERRARCGCVKPGPVPGPRCMGQARCRRCGGTLAVGGARA